MKIRNVSHQLRDFEMGAGVAVASQKDLIFLRQATDALYVSVDRTLPRLVSAIEKLRYRSRSEEKRPAACQLLYVSAQFGQ